IHLDQHSDLAAHVNVRPHGALRRDARLALFEFGLARLAQNFDGLVEIATRLGERFLAGHHPGLSLFSQISNHFLRNFCHQNSPHNYSPSTDKKGEAAQGADGAPVEINNTLESNITPRSRLGPGPFPPQPFQLLAAARWPPLPSPPRAPPRDVSPPRRFRPPR